LNDDLLSCKENILKEIKDTVGSSIFYIAFSGGMDSTVAACLAKEALGTEKVRLVHFSFGPYTYTQTSINVVSIAKKLSLPLEVIDKQKELELISKYGPSCNRCTRRVKVDGMYRLVKNENSAWIGSGSNQSDTWGQYGIKVHQRCYSPIFDLDKPQISRLLAYYQFDYREVRAGESNVREGCKLKHLMKGLIVPRFHGKAVCHSNELLLSTLTEYHYSARFANVKIIGPLRRNVALVNISPLPSKEIREKIRDNLREVREIDSIHIVDKPITLIIKANPGLCRSPHARYWIENGKVQPEFAQQVSFEWSETPNRSVRSYQVIDFKE
jgi:uncharacterized protein